MIGRLPRQQRQGRAATAQRRSHRWRCALLATVVAYTAAARGATVDALIRQHGVVATLVVESLDGSTQHVVNRARAAERFSPASTFKIPNTLIALDAGVVASADTPFAWDGTVRDVPQWNADQTLASAFRVSCVWCYQEIARAVGATRYRQALARLDYGNRRLGERVDAFWLNGELTISALEQVAFLRRLLQGDLPYDREHIEVLREIMRVEPRGDAAVFAKTGWAGDVGWYVGYVEAPAGIWLFALNLRVDDDAAVALRVPLTMQALVQLGVLE